MQNTITESIYNPFFYIFVAKYQFSDKMLLEKGKTNKIINLQTNDL